MQINSFAVGDFDADGKPDLAASYYLPDVPGQPGGILVLRNVSY